MKMTSENNINYQNFLEVERVNKTKAHMVIGQQSILILIFFLFKFISNSKITILSGISYSKYSIG